LVDSHVHDNMMVLSSAQKKQKLLDDGVGKTTVSEKDAIRLSYMNHLSKMYGAWYARTRKISPKHLQIRNHLTDQLIICD
jgi:predicted YcjX-like family ATPase